MGSSFDTASLAEIEMALAAGATPDRISFGNTIKKERCIGRALKLGIRLFDRIQGDHFTILGMPLLPLLAELRNRGVLET